MRTTTHFESDRGVAFKGAVPPGAVTLLRVGGRALDRLWVEEGYVLDDRQAQGTGTEWSPQLCRTQVGVRCWLEPISSGISATRARCCTDWSAVPSGPPCCCAPCRCE